MAKEQAKSVVCGSNLRQWGLAIRVYAYDENDYMPPNFLWSQYYPYLVCEISSVTRFLNLGLLFDLGYVTQPKLFYCPSENNEGHKFDSYPNPWLETNDPSRGNITRMSYYYYTRVEDIFWNSKLQWDRERAGLADGYNHFVKIGSLKNKAFLSDNVYIPNGYPHYIRKGLNVLYADGSVNFWHDKTRFFKRHEHQIDLQAQDVYDVFDLFDKNR